eukprot:1184991-Prorocentrum_minimum.AAC.6
MLIKRPTRGLYTTPGDRSRQHARIPAGEGLAHCEGHSGNGRGGGGGTALQVTASGVCGWATGYLLPASPNGR